MEYNRQMVDGIVTLDINIIWMPDFPLQRNERMQEQRAGKELVMGNYRILAAN
jgi:hypothetical protein